MKPAYGTDIDSRAQAGIIPKKKLFLVEFQAKPKEFRT